MKVMIIEDVTLNQKILERLLGDQAQCHVYKDGLDGLQAFLDASKTKEPFDVIFLDIMMPGINGFEVLQKIREMDPKSEKVKVIMSTSMADKDNVVKAISYGCDGYLIKPYRKEDIQHQLKKLGLI